MASLSPPWRFFRGCRQFARCSRAFLLMADDAKPAKPDKRTECVKVCMEPDMFLDYTHDAIHADRTLGEFIYLALRDLKYGKGIQSHRDRKVPERDHDAP